MLWITPPAHQSTYQILSAQQHEAPIPFGQLSNL